MPALGMGTDDRVARKKKAVFDLSGQEKGMENMGEMDLTEKARSDLLYLEQINVYAENTRNTPEYIRAMAMYTQALHVIEKRYGDLEHIIYRSK